MFKHQSQIWASKVLGVAPHSPLVRAKTWLSVSPLPEATKFHTIGYD